MLKIADPVDFVDRALQDIRPPAFSDDALALRFTERHKLELRYVAAWGKWMRWSGTVWRAEETLHAYDAARTICREAAAECNKPKIASALAAAKTVSAVERLARSDRAHAATSDQWDADIWVLNSTAGLVDMRSGGMRPHRGDDYVTKVTGCAPDPHCKIPTWIAFLDRIFAGDRELIAFMQRVAGYCLTGSTKEHALFFLYGVGANGKSTLLSTVAGIMGDYAQSSPIETFTITSGDRHPTDLAGLRGARLVSAVETEEGRRWAESKIKTLTGGDKISARLMRQDFFEYVPQFKLLIAGNHKPSLRTVDEAIRRRFHLIPFTVTIPTEERDPDLPERLKAEWPGILHWMIEGCLAWQREGLTPPATVKAATSDYLSSQDAIAAWIDDQCETDPNAWERSASLFASWKFWAERSGEQVGDTKAFRDRLEARGVFHRREPGTGHRGFQGLRLRTDPENHGWKPL